MALVDRVKNIIMNPRAEWPVIAGESATVGSLYTGYILILAAIGPIAMVIRSPLIGFPLAIVTYLISLGVIYVIALIADALAPTFGGEKNFVDALKLTAYAHTAAWVAGIFRLLPWIGAVLVLLATLYSIYTFYLGAPFLRKSSAEKAAGYTIVVVLCAIVLSWIVFGVVLGMIFGGAALTGMGMMR